MRTAIDRDSHVISGGNASLKIVREGSLLINDWRYQAFSGNTLHHLVLPVLAARPAAPDEEQQSNSESGGEDDEEEISALAGPPHCDGVARCSDQVGGEDDLIGSSATQVGFVRYGGFRR